MLELRVKTQRFAGGAARSLWRVALPSSSALQSYFPERQVKAPLLHKSCLMVPQQQTTLFRLSDLMTPDSTKGLAWVRHGLRRIWREHHAQPVLACQRRICLLPADFLRDNVTYMPHLPPSHGLSGPQPAASSQSPAITAILSAAHPCIPCRELRPRQCRRTAPAGLCDPRDLHLTRPCNASCAIKELQKQGGRLISLDRGEASLGGLRVSFSRSGGCLLCRRQVIATVILN